MGLAGFRASRAHHAKLALEEAARLEEEVRGELVGGILEVMAQAKADVAEYTKKAADAKAELDASKKSEDKKDKKASSNKDKKASSNAEIEAAIAAGNKA